MNVPQNRQCFSVGLLTLNSLYLLSCVRSFVCCFSSSNAFFFVFSLFVLFFHSFHSCCCSALFHIVIHYSIKVYSLFCLLFRSVSPFFTLRTLSIIQFCTVRVEKPQEGKDMARPKIYTYCNESMKLAFTVDTHLTEFSVFACAVVCDSLFAFVCIHLS